MSEYCLKVICALCCIYGRHDSQNAGDRERKARLFSDSAQEGGGLSVFISCVARQQRFSHPDEQAVIGFTERALLATCIPMMAWSAACGFPSLAEDYVDRPLDFNELLIEHPAATFAIRIEGDSMTGAGIFPGDIRRPRSHSDQWQYRAGAARWRLHGQALAGEKQCRVAAGRKPGVSRHRS